MVLTHSEWHAGVIGIVAGRMVEYLGRPVLIIAQKEGSSIATGSGGSIPGLALGWSRLRACDSELLGHGGHAMAAGFKVGLERIDALRQCFSRYAADHFPQGVPPAPRLVLDAEVPLSTLTVGLVKDLDRLEPYGADNPRPRFLASRVQVSDPRRIGTGERHMSFRLKQGPTTLRAVAFGMADRMDELLSAGGQCCVAFTPKINEWMGQRKVELEVADFQPSPVHKARIEAEKVILTLEVMGLYFEGIGRLAQLARVPVKERHLGVTGSSPVTPTPEGFLSLVDRKPFPLTGVELTSSSEPQSPSTRIPSPDR